MWELHRTSRGVRPDGLDGPVGVRRVKTSMHILTHDATLTAARCLSSSLPDDARIYPVPRGGVAAAYAVLNYAPQTARIVEKPQDANVFVDDIIDSGATRERYAADFPNVPFLALFNKKSQWLVFPWEGTTEGSAEDICLRLLQFIGEDVSRGGLRETPGRFLRAWKDWTAGYGQAPEDVLKTFEDGAEKYDEMVVSSGIPAWSTCEHHLAPIFGVAHIGYVPDKRIVGLSKLNRLVDVFGRRLQVQERWTTQIANALEDYVQPRGVAVVIEARHLCMESRGVCHAGTVTRTSAMRGVLMEKPEARAEFLRLIGK